MSPLSSAVSSAFVNSIPSPRLSCIAFTAPALTELSGTPGINEIAVSTRLPSGQSSGFPTWATSTEEGPPDLENGMNKPARATSPTEPLTCVNPEGLESPISSERLPETDESPSIASMEDFQALKTASMRSSWMSGASSAGISRRSRRALE